MLDAAARERADRVRELQRRSAEAQAEASAASRHLVAELRASGLTVRAVAAVVGIWPQRVSQLAR